METQDNALGGNPQTAAPTDGQSTPTVAPVAPAPDAQLVTASAPEQGTTPTPGTEGGLQLDAETLKFLENQNIDANDPAKVIAELAKRNQDLRSRKPEASSTPASQEIKDALVGKAEQPETKTEAPATQAPKLPSDLEIVTMALAVNKAYPDVTVDAQFYTDMKNDGFVPVSADGGLKVQNVLNYASYRQKLADADKAIASAQPNPAGIPEPSTKVEQFADVAPVQTMDMTAAQNIVLFSSQESRYGRPPHAQLEEAKRYLAEHAFDK